MATRLLLAALLAASAAALLGPHVAAAATAGDRTITTVVDDFRYADAAAARAAWKPMEGSADVAPDTVEGRTALRMPCRFKGTRIERASWDRTVSLDLTDCRGIRFRFFIRDAAPVGQFSLYFQSGDGWYAASFAPREKNRWHTITVDKEDTRIEGRPAGWGKVRTIRLSAWRGKNEDTDFCLADLETVGVRADVLVVRAESAARERPNEAQSVDTYTQEMAGHLAALGVGYAVVSDLDLTPERLKGKRLVVFPHNPTLPDAADAAVRGFLAGGGKAMAFYSLPGSLAEAAGIQWKGHVSQKYRGHFASIRFAEGALAGAPPVVGQMSWNVQEVRPADDRTRVAATWFDDKGNDLGYPAVLVNDRFVYITHVVLSDDLAHKRRMLLAMIGHLVPEAWRDAAAGALEGLGRMGPFETFDEARAGVAKAAGADRGALDALARAVARRDEAGALSAQGKFAESMDAAQEAQRLLTDAWCLAQKAVPGEHRAFWCHSAFGPAGMTWDAAIKTLAESGFTAILPNMLWGGAAYYDSKVLPVAPEVAEKGDQVALCLAACKKYGIECHVWKVNWNLGWNVPKEFAARMKREGRTQVNYDGSPNDGWLCPSHPENRRLEIDAMVEVGTEYDVHGVHFDYIRYPGREGCYCPGCRERFEKAAGVKVAHWPADLRNDAALEAKWLDFRRDQITAVVAAVSKRLRKERPACRISAAVFPNWPADRDGIGQDWRLWCDRGYLDFVCPMDYTPHAMAFENFVASQIEWAGKVPCYPGIGLSTWPDQGDVARLIEQISIARRLGTRGFTIFEFNATTAREIVPLCGKGITRKD